jgi:hypothetical protein
VTPLNHQPTSVAHKVTIVGLVVGAVGIGILWASGVEFPFYPPPGIIILLAGALFVEPPSSRRDRHTFQLHPPTHRPDMTTQTARSAFPGVHARSGAGLSRECGDTDR